ncbi:MAG: flagellar hook-associated protein FlgK [Alphaproteobacteria bacterium]|nr:flagellar hook-associated protein FlgK [Alphaproteobacteria bacterium]
MTMSLTDALSIAISGVQTSAVAAQVISGNVANAQTAGYTDKSLGLSEIINGSGFGGVGITSYNRVTNSVLSATLNNATSSASYLSTQSNYMNQVQSILDSTGNPPALSSALSNFQSAWTEYSANPSDVTLQKTVISSGETLSSTITGISSQVSTLQTNVENDLSTSVQGLNTALAKITMLNGEIATALANNSSAVNLEDQRDVAVNQVAQYTAVTIMPRSNGQIALYTPGGTALVDGQAQTFSTGTDPITGDPCVTNAVGNNVSDQLTGGTLQAETDFLSSSTSTANGVGVVGKLQSQLLAFANAFISPAEGGFADTYDDATTATGEQDSDFFTANTDANGNISDLTSFAVNASLVNGKTSVKEAAATDVANTFSATNLSIDTTKTPPVTTSTFTADGLTAQNQTYSGISTAILSGFQQAANAIQAQNASASTQQAYYQSSLSSQTGVNTDTELVNLTNWENSYAASAHVISTIQSMMKTLENMVS